MYFIYKGADLYIRQPNVDTFDSSSKIEIFRLSNDRILGEFWDKSTYENLHDASDSFADPEAFRDAVFLSWRYNENMANMDSDSEKEMRDAYNARLNVEFLGCAMHLSWSPLCADLLYNFIDGLFRAADGLLDA